ncbi:MAG: hypothetical protein II912_00870 [Clostridia bacterium]|nr:hypothetical protein [Clostridia bacterium]
MFGYVRIDPGTLGKAEKARFRSIYCGVCECLRSAAGPKGRMALSYDAAFLAAVLGALYEPEETAGRGVCAAHPVKKHAFVLSEMTAYAADIDLLLAFYNCLDDWADDKSRLKELGAKQLMDAFLSARARRMRQAFAIEKQLGRLRRFERERSGDVLGAADCFGSMLGEVFAYRDDMWAPALKSMGAALGRFIYIMDAWDDARRDEKKGRYNPLKDMRALPDYEERVYDLLQTQMALCAGAFETLPIVQDIGILRNIIYSGVWTRYSIKRRDAAGEENA